MHRRNFKVNTLFSHSEKSRNMSGSGTGRGRGWLNLNKNPTARPGGVPSTTTNSNSYIDSLSQDFSTATLNMQAPQYPRLVALLEQLDPNDDGILLNQKLKSILQSWKNECNSGAEVEESFKYVYSKCLQDASLATKIVTMVSSYSFITKEVHDVKIRNLFIAHIQNDFENSKHLQAVNPTGFRNAVRMLGEFYHKARLANGCIIKFLAAPIVRYFDMLLESAQPADLELFTSQLYLNGAAIKADCPQKMQEILMQVRHLLLNNANLTQVCRTWMLLALDVVYNRFGLLPTELDKFYQEQLGDKAMGNFQGTHSALSIQTSHSNKSLDSYQSTVSVLQVTPPESTSPVNEQNSSNQFNLQTDPQNFSSLHSFNSQSYGSESNDWDSAKDSKPATNNREKVGRPILGAGARLQRNRVADESSNSNWRDQSKENSAGWDSKQKMGSGKAWSGSKKGHGGGKSNKGWEHDDRFENDY